MSQKTENDSKSPSHPAIQFRADRPPLTVPGSLDCHVEDFTATISADVKLATAQEVLGEFNQWLPIDGDAQTTLGELVEQNSTGPLRMGFGAWRDLLLGCQFQIGTGELITAGGRTVKNVAGYDLVKFMVGQRGIFGKLVTLTTRTYRRPPAALVADFAPSDQLISQIVGTPLRPRWAMLTPQSLRCGWLDEEPAIELFEKLAAEHHPANIQRRTLGEDIDDRAARWKAPADHIRVAVPPAKILTFAELAHLNEWVADACFGIVLIPLEKADRAQVERTAATLGGSAIVFVNGLPQWGPTTGEAAILASLKKAFDPAGSLPMLTSTPS